MILALRIKVRAKAANKNKQSEKKWPVNDVGVYTTNKVDGYPVTAIWHCTWSKYLWERLSVALCYGKILS